MARENNHGENSNSTASIFDLLKNHNEDALPDDLLPAESETKKKRAAKKFFEDVCYIVMMESIRIHEHFVKFMLEEMERKTIERELELNSQNRGTELNVLQQLMNQYQLQSIILTEEQHQWLQTIKDKLDRLLSDLNFKLDELNQNIANQQQKIELLERQLEQVRHQLAEQWTKHFLRHISDPDFQPLRIDLAFSEKLNSLFSDRDDKKYIELDQAIYSHLAKTIGEELRSGQISVYDIKNSLQEKLAYFIENQLNKTLSFMHPDDRKQVIKDLLEENQIQSLALAQIGRDLANNREFTKELNNVCTINRDLAKERTKSEILKKGYDAIVNITSSIKEMTDKIDYLENNLSRLEDSIVPDPSLTHQIDAQLDVYNNFSNSLIDTSNSILGELEKNLANIDSIDLDFNNFLSELNVAKDKAKSDEAHDEIQQQTILDNINHVGEKSDNLLRSGSGIKKETSEPSYQQETDALQTESTFKSRF